MPRFDHMKGEVSVKNLVWRQGRRQFSLGGEVGPKVTPQHLQPHQSWLLGLLISERSTPQAAGDGVEAAEKQLLGGSSPCPPLPCHIKAEAQVKNGVADPCSSEKKEVRGCSPERSSPT